MHVLDTGILAEQASALCSQPQPQPQLHEITTLSTHSAGAEMRPAMVGSLILDGNGTIMFCSNALALLVGTTASELVGRTIKSLLPEMPLSPTTPGYNVAFAAFSWAAGSLHQWMLIRSDGSKLAVDASITSLKTSRDYLFCLGLHCPSEPGVVLDELHQIDPSTSIVADKAASAVTGQARQLRSPRKVTQASVMSSNAWRIRSGSKQNFS